MENKKEDPNIKEFVSLSFRIIDISQANENDGRIKHQSSMYDAMNYSQKPTIEPNSDNDPSPPEESAARTCILYRKRKISEGNCEVNTNNGTISVDPSGSKKNFAGHDDVQITKPLFDLNDPYVEEGNEDYSTTKRLVGLDLNKEIIEEQFRMDETLVDLAVEILEERIATNYKGDLESLLEKKQQKKKIGDAAAKKVVFNIDLNELP